MTYVGVPVTTDPDVLAEAALSYLTSNIPGWVPRDGNLEVWLVNALAQMLATSRDVASIVPDQIFEYFGSTVMNLPPIAAAPATVTATITAQDNAGYTIPSGSQFGFQVTGSNLVIFRTTAAVVIPPGSTTAAGVTLTAEIAGSAANGHTGALTVVDPLAFITTATATTSSAGGVDAETATAYLGRLVAELQLMSPRPILPSDFGTLARSVAGVHRALGIDGYSAGRTFTDGQTANASNVLTSPASAAFVPADVGRTVTDTGGAIPVGTTISSWISATQVHMSNNATAAVNPDTITLGSLTNQERTVAVSAVDASGATVSSAIQASLISYLQSQRELNFIVTFVAPTYTQVNVSYTVHLSAGADWTSVQAAVNAAIQGYLSQATWGGGGQTPPIWESSATVVRYLQLAGIIEAVAGVDYVAALTLNGSAADVNLPGVAPLANYGTITAAHT